MKRRDPGAPGAQRHRRGNAEVRRQGEPGWLPDAVAAEAALAGINLAELCRVGRQAADMAGDDTVDASRRALALEIACHAGDVCGRLMLQVMARRRCAGGPHGHA